MLGLTLKLGKTRFRVFSYPKSLLSVFFPKLLQSSAILINFWEMTRVNLLLSSMSPGVKASRMTREKRGPGARGRRWTLTQSRHPFIAKRRLRVLGEVRCQSGGRDHSGVVPFEDWCDGGTSPWWCVHPSPDLGVGDEASLNQPHSQRRGILQGCSSQLTVGAWRVLTFKVLCNRFLPKACSREEFCVVYMMRKGMVMLVPSPPQRGCDKLSIYPIAIMDGVTLL